MQAGVEIDGWIQRFWTDKEAERRCCLDRIWHLMKFYLIFIPSPLGQKGKAWKVTRVMNRFICYLFIHSRKITSTKRCHIYRGCLTSHAISAMKNPHVRFKWLTTRDCTGSSNKVCYTFTFLSHIFLGIQSEFFFSELLVSMKTKLLHLQNPLTCEIFEENPFKRYFLSSQGNQIVKQPMNKAELKVLCMDIFD